MEVLRRTEWWSDARGRSRQTMVVYVREALRGAILSGELPGGSRLVQADLAAALEVSTTPIREALRDLANEGLVQFDPHRGAVVNEMTPEELEEIYQICRVLEPMAIREAVARADADLVARLRELHGQMLAETNALEWIDLNRAFHNLIYAASGKPQLTAIIQKLRDARVMFIGPVISKDPALLEEVNRDHAAIIEAIERRNASAAVHAILSHLTLADQVRTHETTEPE